MVSVYESATVKRRLTSGLVAGAFFALQLVPMFTVFSGSASAQVPETEETQTMEVTDSLLKSEPVDQLQTQTEEVEEESTSEKTEPDRSAVPTNLPNTLLDHCGTVYNYETHSFQYNYDCQPKPKKSMLILKKVVVNDNGGTLTKRDFTPTLNKQVADWGDNKIEPNKNYELNELGFVNRVGWGNVGFGYLQSIVCRDEGGVYVHHAPSLKLSEGQTVTCTFTNNDIPPKVTVTKRVEKGDKTMPFDFKIKNKGQTFADVSLSDMQWFDSNTRNPRLSAGQVSVEEVVPEGWMQDKANCFDEKGKNVGTSFHAEVGKRYDCVFRNSQKGQLIVTKDARPNSEQDFSFVVTRVCERPDHNVNVLTVLSYNNGYQPAVCVEELGFLLDDDDDVTLSNTKAQFVRPGVYTITENGVDGWKLADITCGEAEVVSRTDTSVTVKVDGGQTVHCTFVNDKEEKPQVLGETTPKVSSVSTLADTGETNGIQFSLMAIAILVAAVATTVRTQKQEA